MSGEKVVHRMGVQRIDDEEMRGCRIRLRLPVSEIKIDGNGVVVTCADGRTIEADDVVLATPPSTWDRIKF